MPDFTPTIPSGLRVYAIGDIHGSLELLRDLLAKIDAENAALPGRTQFVFLGDYIDRGLYSKQTFDFLLQWRDTQKSPPIFLMGNHEQVMLNLLNNKDLELLKNWLQFGGRETLMSYGVNPSLAVTDTDALFAAMVVKVPKEHVELVGSMKLSATFGDYFFCHAGVRPGTKLAEQAERDLCWIRQDFIRHTGMFEKMIVHGHTIASEAEFMPNRIGIDTGAYATGRLTALGLEGSKQWLVQTA
jgi:serine/threonine protein phosphatase 1